MNTDSIRQNLTESERAKFEHGAKLLAELQKGKSFDDWLPIGEGLVALRGMVMRVLHINRPFGRYYSATLSKARKETAYAHLSNSTCSHLTYIMDNLPTVEAMRGGWNADEHVRWVHPDTVAKRLREYLKGTTVQTEAHTDAMSPYRKLQNELEEAHRAIDLLKRQADDGGNLWKANDMARDIAAFLYPHFAKMSEKKCRAVLKELGDRLNADWNKAKREREMQAKGKRDDRERTIETR